MAIFIFLIEDLRGMNALLQSKGYVEKYWIPVLGRWLFIGLFLLLLCIPFLIIELLSIQLLSEIVLIITVSIVIPIASIFGFLIYGNLRLLRGDTTAYVNILQSTNSTKQKLDVLRSTFYKGALLGLPLVLYLLYSYVTRPFLVQGNSMTPAYIHNEIVITSILRGNSQSLQRGDVVIFESPVDPEKKLIKRIVGMPGETVSIQKGELYINIDKLDEKAYLPAETVTKEGSFLREGYLFIIPRNHYFVLGDNRRDSEDSRAWGAIRAKDIIGKIRFCLWGCPKEESNKK
jgi:signal peptidase I